MSKLIDANALEKDGWIMYRIVQVDEKTMSYQTKKPTDFPTIEPEPQWIPCSERLPEKYIGEWLCCTDDGNIMILPYDTPGDGSKECVFYAWDDNGYFYQTFDVTAWMPLPKPYKEKS